MTNCIFYNNFIIIFCFVHNYAIINTFWRRFLMAKIKPITDLRKTNEISDGSFAE